MLHAWPDNTTVSVYHGLHRQPYDFLSHPMAPCGTLLVAHDPVREKWDNYGRIGFYLGPAVTHYRSYHCFITDTNATRICDSVMFDPTPLVLPGTSRFDQLLQLYYARAVDNLCSRSQMNSRPNKRSLRLR